MESGEVCIIAFVTGVAALLVLLILLLKPRRKIQKESVVMRIGEGIYLVIAAAIVLAIAVIWMIVYFR